METSFLVQRILHIDPFVFTKWIVRLSPTISSTDGAIKLRMMLLLYAAIATAATAVATIYEHLQRI